MLKKAVFTVFLLVAGSAFAGGQLMIPEVEYNFGKIPQHAEVSHRFMLKSTGDDSLRITQIVPGCGCTKAPIEDSVLAPGESTFVEIIFSSRSYRGSVAKRPYVVTDASDDKHYMRVTTDVLTDPEASVPLRFTPYKLDVSQFGEKTRRTAAFTIENVGEQAYELTVLDTTGRSFDVEVPMSIAPGEKITGKVIVHEDQVKSDFDQSITFELNDRGKTRYTLPVGRMYRERGPASFGSSGK